MGSEDLVRILFAGKRLLEIREDRARLEKLSDQDDATMMTSRDRVISTLNHEPVDQAPRDLWPSPAMETCRADELAEMLFRYPSDFQKPDFAYPAGTRTRGTRYEVGPYTDAWGCTWRVTQPGTVGELRHSPLEEESALAGYRPPLELLDGANLDRVNRGCAATSCFVSAWTETRPFERLRFLRGSGQAISDVAAGSRTLRELLRMLHDFTCREIQMWASTDVDGVVFTDNWGPPGGLLIPLDAWRDSFKPLYRDYCEILHQNDKFAFFSTDGDSSEVFADLVEIGVDAIQCRPPLTDVESLAGRLRGLVTFWAEVDLEQVPPLGTPDDVRAAVRRVRKALDYGCGGVIARCRWDLQVAFENVVALFEAWLAPLAVHA